jgi:hypothetical protein
MNPPAEPIVDLRSDTVTLPSERMFDAARAADLGDDVYREDPTVARLEACAAELMGLGAGPFLPSGTMANLCALLTHGQRGQRVVCGGERMARLFNAPSRARLRPQRARRLRRQRAALPVKGLGAPLGSLRIPLARLTGRQGCTPIPATTPATSAPRSNTPRSSTTPFAANCTA